MGLVKVVSFVGLVALLLLLGGALAISGPVLAGEQGEGLAAWPAAERPRCVGLSPAPPQSGPAATGREMP